MAEGGIGNSSCDLGEHVKKKQQILKPALRSFKMRPHTKLRPNTTLTIERNIFDVLEGMAHFCVVP